MEVKSGYKQTEVGLIPEDWQIASLSTISKEPMQNGVFYKPSRKGCGVKLINVGDLYAQTPIDSDSLALFNATIEECGRFKVGNGDLLFTRSSVVPSGIAHCNIYCSPKTDSVVFDSHVIRLKPDTEKVFPLYLFRYCIASIARHYLIAHAKTGAMTTIDQSVLGKCPVILPLPAEQEAIAEMLSDADALIESLEQLVAKKRNLKQGAMQELLTGKRRLPGFEIKRGYKQTEVGIIPEDWVASKVGNFSNCYSGGTPNTSILSYYGGDIAWITSSDLNKMRIKDVQGKISKEGLSNSSAKLVSKGTLLLALYGATAGISAITEIDAAINQAVLAIIPDSENVEYLFQYFQYKKDFFITTYTQGGQPNFSGEIVKSFAIPLPPTEAEQETIANILSDMDMEIASLEAKLAKACHIKQGMMQELLTGRIRLVKRAN